MKRRRPQTASDKLLLPTTAAKNSTSSTYRSVEKIGGTFWYEMNPSRHPHLIRCLPLNRRTKARRRRALLAFSTFGACLLSAFTMSEASAVTTTLSGRDAIDSRRLQTERQCTLSMAIQDTNQDNLLSQGEFVNFLNQLFANRFSNTPYESLPCPVQELFQEYADGNSIDVEGTKPGQTASAEQAERISALCAEIISLMATNPTGGPCGDPGLSPVPAPGDGGGGGGEIDCTGTIGRPQCNTALTIADLSRDDLLDSTEFVRFVNRLSGNEYRDSTFADLPENIQQAFNKFAQNGSINLLGTKPGQVASQEQDEAINALCCETDVAIRNPGSPVAAPVPSPTDDGNGNGGGGGGSECTGTIPRNQCNSFMAVADMNLDDLINQDEYIRFINRISGNEYTGVSYSDLPVGLRNNFERFATSNGQINVFGSKPGQTPSAEQAEFLALFCCETENAVANPDQGGDVGSPTDPTPVPPTTPQPPTFEPRFCQIALASSDFDRNDGLNQVEYIRFLNRLTSNEFAGASFADLSEALQANFVENVDGEEVNIFGTKPGQTPTSEQAAFIAEFCVSTAVALQSDDGETGPSPVPEPTPVPAGGGTPPADVPTFPETFCRTAMASADTDWDDYLSQEEFVAFLNRLTQNEFEGSAFEDLPIPLPDTYANLADNSGEIWIFGSRPGQDAADSQEEFVLNICLEVAIALDNLGEVPPPGSPVVAPTPAPQQVEGPTLPPGIVEVSNSFIISNTGNLRAANLQSGSNRGGLENSYNEFVQRVVGELSQRLLTQLRARRLAVSFVEDSNELYLLLDDDCPEGRDEQETCQVVFARFWVSIDDEDPQNVLEEYTDATQQQISDGILQDTLREVDPLNSLTIVGASLPLVPDIPPTPAPVTAAPQQPTGPSGNGGSDDDEDGGSSAGAIVGGIFGTIALCALIGWVSTKYGGKNKKGPGEEDDDDDDKPGDDASEGDREDDGIGRFGDDKKPEQNPADTKNVFGFGKKNKDKDDDDNAFGIDANPSGDNAFGDDSNNNLELFAFDEPSLGKTGDADGASAAENGNAFGGGEAGWGNTNEANGFFGGGSGGGWGAPGGDPGGSANFFGASAFGEADQRGSSPSGSASGSGSRSASGSGSDEDSYGSSDGDSRGSGSYDDDEDGSFPDEGSGSHSGSYSRSSADEGSSYESGSRSESWEKDVKKPPSFSGSSRSSFQENGSGRRSGSEDEGSFSGSESGSESHSASGSETTATTNTADLEKRGEYRAQVDALVRLVLPDEVEKVDAMMEQFRGREAELVSTLQTMQERSATQRARAAVHKSRNKPQRGEDGAFALGAGVAGGAEGSAIGTAAIAAASLPIPADGMYEDEEGDFDADEGFGGDEFGVPPEEEEFDDEEGSGSYSGSGSGSGSYRSGSQSGSGSYRSGSQSGSGSYRSGSQSGSGSYRSGSQSGSGSYSGSSRSGSQSQGSRSYYSGEEGSGSHRSGSQSQGSRSGSYVSGEEGSGSYRSGSQSQGSRSGSFVSGEEGSGSYRSGSQSQGSRSYHSGEGSRSYISGEGSRSQGSRSYHSGEDEERSGSGSYRSGSEYSDEEGSFEEE